MLILVSERPKTQQLQPRPARTHWTPDEDAALRELAAEGLTSPEIAAIIGRSVCSVHNHAKHLRVKPKSGTPGIKTGFKRPPDCARCGILLSAAPPGWDGRCGWCQQEGLAQPVIEAKRAWLAKRGKHDRTNAY